MPVRCEPSGGTARNQSALTTKTDVSVVTARDCSDARHASRASMAQSRVMNSARARFGRVPIGVPEPV